MHIPQVERNIFERCVFFVISAEFLGREFWQPGGHLNLAKWQTNFNAKNVEEDEYLLKFSFMDTFSLLESNVLLTQL